MGIRGCSLENLVTPTRQFWQNKKVLITGHTGFKGGWLTSWLVDLGAHVVGVALEPSTTPNLFSVLRLRDKISHHNLDIRDYNALFSVIKNEKPEIVFHLAAQALVVPSYEDPIGTYSTNVMGAVHLFEACRKAFCPKVIVNVTSDKCYENKEWHWAYRENEPMGGFDPYSNSKGCSELVTSAFRQSFFKAEGTQLASARAGNVIGGGDWAYARLIPDIIRAFSQGETVQIRSPYAIRPWQHVLEPLCGYLAIAEKCYNEQNLFDCGWNFGPEDSDTRPVRYIVEKMVELWGDESKFEVHSEKNQPHEAKYLKLDSSMAKAKLFWRPRLNLEQTLHWTVEWYKRWLQNDDMGDFTKLQISEYCEFSKGEIDEKMPIL